jgi:hypothetical protein
VVGLLPGTLNGAEDDDTMIGGAGGDAMNGGEGVDVLRGNEGADQLTVDGQANGANELADAGPGDDILVAAALDGPDDRYVGGPGIDLLVAGAVDPLHVNLATGALVAGPQTDSVSGIEDVTTTQGADTITGDSGSNIIESAFDFFAAGGAGQPLPPDQSDTVNPGTGVDTVLTGAGDDTVNSNDGYGDFVRCGTGSDTVEADALDALIDCEAVNVVQVAPPPGADVQGAVCAISGVPSTVGRASFFRGRDVGVSCDEAAAVVVQAVVRVKRGGNVTAAAVAGELILAEVRLDAASGPRAVRLRTPKRLARSLGKGRFTVRLRVEATDLAGNRSLANGRLRVKAAKKKKRR